MQIEEEWPKSKKLPFSRIIGLSSERGKRKTLYMFFVVLMRHFIPHFGRRIKYVSYKYISKYNEVVAEINSSKMWLNLSDKGIGSDLFLYRKREPISTDYLMKSGVLKEGDVVLDIGANIGYYALMESRLVSDSGKVYAIEPVSSNIQALKRNIQLNNYKNIETFHLAVGNKNEKSLVYISAKSNLSAMERSLSRKEIVSTEEVDVVTVDSFLKDKTIPNLIRMDVEGYEYYIIKGMSKTLKKNVKILMELHPRLLPKEQLEELLQILKENNFKVQFFIRENYVTEHKIVQYFSLKGGAFPIILLSKTIDELRQVIQAYPSTAHVLFSKM